MAQTALNTAVSACEPRFKQAMREFGRLAMVDNDPARTHTLRGGRVYLDGSRDQTPPRLCAEMAGITMLETMWRYQQLRAGQVYIQTLFETKQEAEQFALQMDRFAPDMFSRIEEIEARKVWN
jgi:hypothetical protein